MMLSAKLSASTAAVTSARPSRRRVVKTQAFQEDEKRGVIPNAKREAPKATRYLNMTGTEYARTLPGICAPFPNMFDPAGFTRNATPDDVKRWRESEITHGRVAMLASLGFIVQEQTMNKPFFLNDWGAVNGPAIFHAQQIETQRPLFWEILVLGIGLAEAYRVRYGWATPIGDNFNQLRDDYAPGDLSFDPLGLKPTDPANLKDMQTRELNNGRLAMLSIIAFWLQELRDPNHTILEQFKHTLTGEYPAQLASDIVEGVKNIP